MATFMKNVKKSGGGKAGGSSNVPGQMNFTLRGIIIGKVVVTVFMFQAGVKMIQERTRHAGTMSVQGPGS